MRLERLVTCFRNRQLRALVQACKRGHLGQAMSYERRNLLLLARTQLPGNASKTTPGSVTPRPATASLLSQANVASETTPGSVTPRPVNVS